MKKRIRTFAAFLLSVALTVLLAAPSFASVPGDADKDGGVTAADARLALRCAVDLEQLPEARRYAIDVDTDTAVSAADARLILRNAIGLETFTPPSADGDLTIDGVSVLRDGKLSDGIVKAGENLYWVCESGDNSYYLSNDLSEIVAGVYGELRELFGIDPCRDHPLLVKLFLKEKHEDWMPNTNYFGDGFRIRINEHTPEEDWASVKPVAVYELSHEMTHFFLWTVKCNPLNPGLYPYQQWNEEIFCEGMALWMLERLDGRIDSPEYTLAHYLDYYTNPDRGDIYPMMDALLHGLRSMSEDEFAELSENVKSEWRFEISYMYRMLSALGEENVNEVLNMYDHVMSDISPVDYGKWIDETGNVLIERISLIQPKVK